VIGGGPTGVEMAGTLAEIARHTLAGEFRRIDPASAEVLLIEGGPRVLQAMPEGLSQKASEQLERLGVEVRLNARVTAIDATGLDIAVGAEGATERIDSHCVVWAAGVAASPLGRLLATATGAEVDRAGRIRVEPDLSLAGHPEISVVGDLAAAMSHAPGKDPKPVPGVSPGAKQMGRTAAANMLHRPGRRADEAFRYRDYGNLATIGRNSAVVDLGTPFGPLRFSGKLAWLFWLFAHVYFLIGFPQPAGRADGLGQRLLELPALCARGGRRGCRSAPACCAGRRAAISRARRWRRCAPSRARRRRRGRSAR
jgi:NADH dehydrogenase